MNFKLSKFLKGFGSVLILVLILAIYKGVGIYTAIKNSPKGAPPAAVTTTTANPTSWKSFYKTAGTVKGDQSATLKAESSGRVTKINVLEGQEVKAGTVLVELDSKVEEAEYLAGLAQRDLSEKEYQRQKNLFALKAISQDEFDKSRLTYESLKAAAEALRSRLERRQIIAPFNGKVGVIRVNLGQYIEEKTDITTIENPDSLYVVFSLGQNALRALDNKILNEIEVIISLAGSNKYYSATLKSIDPLLDNFTKTALAKAYISSEDLKNFKSGMSVGVAIVINKITNVIIIPTSSISFAPFGDSVYIADKSQVNDSNPLPIAKQQFVKIIESQGDVTAIESGIKAGEEVITSGTFKLFPGVSLIINNSVKPGDDLNPNPENT